MMFLKFPRFFRESRARFFSLLCVFWLLGLLVGAVLSLTAGTDFSAWMRAAPCSRVSIVGLLSISLLPLLFSAFVVSIHLPWLLMPICFGKAFCFAYLAMGLNVAFGSAGWLIRTLLLFSDTAQLPILWIVWIRAIQADQRCIFWQFFAGAVICAAFGSFDYCMIAPFLADLLSR